MLIVSFKKGIVFLLVLVMGLTAVVLCLGHSAGNDTFSKLFALPLVTTIIISLQMFSINRVKGWSPIFIGTVYFVRNVVGPLVLAIDRFQSKFGLIDRFDVQNAILIMSWETLCVYIFIAFFIFRRTANYDFIVAKKKIYFGRTIYVASLIMGCIISVYALMQSTELRNSFFSIFTSNFYEVNSDITSPGGVLLMLYIMAGKYSLALCV